MGCSMSAFSSWRRLRIVKFPDMAAQWTLEGQARLRWSKCCLLAQGVQPRAKTGPKPPWPRSSRDLKWKRWRKLACAEIRSWSLVSG